MQSPPSHFQQESKKSIPSPQTPSRTKPLGEGCPTSLAPSIMHPERVSANTPVWAARHVLGAAAVLVSLHGSRQQTILEINRQIRPDLRHSLSAELRSASACLLLAHLPIGISRWSWQVGHARLSRPPARRGGITTWRGYRRWSRARSVTGSAGQEPVSAPNGSSLSQTSPELGGFCFSPPIGAEIETTMRREIPHPSLEKTLVTGQNGQRGSQQDRQARDVDIRDGTVVFGAGHTSR
jgi:hypothetical protein